MSVAQLAPASHHRDALRSRVDAYRRYAELLAAQLSALEGGDLDAFDALAELRDRLAEEIDAGPTLPSEWRHDPTAPSDPEVDRLLVEAQHALARCAEADQLVRQRLQGLRAETLAAIRSIEGRQPAVRQYLEADAPSGRLDVRL
jgi:hypothetical protein